MWSVWYIERSLKNWLDCGFGVRIDEVGMERGGQTFGVLVV